MNVRDKRNCNATSCWCSLALAGAAFTGAKITCDGHCFYRHVAEMARGMSRGQRSRHLQDGRQEDSSSLLAEGQMDADRVLRNPLSMLFSYEHLQPRSCTCPCQNEGSLGRGGEGVR